MEKLTVYKQLTTGVGECLNVLNREIGLKTTCSPFAVKLIGALNETSPKNETDMLGIADTLLSGLQTLMQGGIMPEDYDKIDFVKRGGKIVVSARVEAFLRACARKGYRLTDTIVAVPKEDFNTTYFKENFYNGDIIYTLEDRRLNADRVVTAERLVEKYFSKFICRIDIHSVDTNKRVAMTVCEISIDDLLQIASSSEQGIYKSEWVEYQTRYGTKKKKVISDQFNTEGFWYKWTGEMVNKTVIRRALKRIKEVLPELERPIYAFEQDEITEEEKHEEKEIFLDIPIIKTEDVNLDKLTSEQKADAQEIYDLFVANPKLAEDKTSEIEAMIKEEISPQEIINREYASLAVLKKSKDKWSRIGGYFDVKKDET